MLLFWILAFSLNFAQNNSNKLSSPEVYSPNENKLYSTTPSFKWNKVEGANGYTIYVFDEENIIFESSNFGAITKEEYEIPNWVLKKNKSYSIKLRAFNAFAWSKYSKPFNFSINEKKEIFELKRPIVISRSATIKDTVNEVINHYLMWNNVKEADSYEVKIEGVNTSSIFGDEYTKLIEETISDTLFNIDQKTITGFVKYRWKIRSKNEKTKSKFTSNYYFNLNEENVITQQNSVEDIVMRLKYAGFVDEMIMAKFSDNEVFLPIIEIMSILKLNHKLDFENEILTGKRHDESKKEFQFLPNENKLLIGENEINIDNGRIFKSDLDYFIGETILENITGMSADIDMRKLTVRLTSDFILPMVQRKLNEQKLSIYKNQETETNYPLLFNRNRKYLSGGFLDYSASASYVDNQSPYYSLGLGLGAEIFGGDIQIKSQQSLSNEKLTYNQIDYKWRYAFLNNDLISNISLGHNNTYGLESYNFNGIQISNEPIEARRIYGHYKVEEKAKPNWKVEVYHNNQLIDIVHADAKGDYDFYIPFSYGTTMLELHEIGPNGEYNIENRMYQIPIEQIPEGRLDYNVNFGEINNTKELLFQSSAKYGINNWLTTEIGSDVFANDLNYSSIYSNTTARLFDGYIANLKIAPNAFNEFSVNSVFSDLASFNIGAKVYDQNLKLNPSKIKNEIEGNIFLPIKLNQNMMSLLFRGKKTSFGNSERTDLSIRTFYNFKNFSPSMEIDYYKLNNGGSNFESAFLNFRLNYSLRFHSAIFSGNIVDARFVYDFMHNKSQSMSFSYSTTIMQQFRVQLSHTTNFQNSYSDTQLRIVFDLPFFRSNTSMAKNIVTQSVIGSINYNQHLDEFNFYNRGMIGRSAASFKFFVDDNMNDKFDDGEDLVPDMDVRINSVGSKRRIDNGNIIINDLEAYSTYDVELIDRYNKNPLWFPYKDKFSFVSDPHQYKEIQVPFYEAAEVLGTVQKRFNNNLIAISGLKIALENNETKEITTIRTMSDGSFYHYGLKPGKYTISLDADQLNRLNLKPKPNKITSIIRSISVEEDFTEFNFILEH